MKMPAMVDKKTYAEAFTKDFLYEQERDALGIAEMEDGGEDE